MKKSMLPVTEELDFHYLLTLMPPLHNEPEFAWLPELFSIVDSEAIVKLCKYCGGETIKIPTLIQLQSSIDALQLFYDIDIKHIKTDVDIPKHLSQLFYKIRSEYYAQNS